MNDLTTQSQGIDANNESLVSSGPPPARPRSRRRMNAPLIGTVADRSFRDGQTVAVKTKASRAPPRRRFAVFSSTSQFVAAYRLLTPIAVMQ